MQIVSNLCEMSNPVVWEKIDKYQIVIAEFAHRVVKESLQSWEHMY